jgi:hypothetical protein
MATIHTYSDWPFGIGLPKPAPKKPIPDKPAPLPLSPPSYYTAKYPRSAVDLAAAQLRAKLETETKEKSE